MPRLSHTPAGAGGRKQRPAVGETVGGAIDRVARALRSARVFFGHGTQSARDEAAELVFFVAGLPHELGAAGYSRVLTARRSARIDRLLERRIRERLPLPYLTHRAFFAGLEFYVDSRVLVPRSPIAELVRRQFAPWIDAHRVARILDVGTGSGAIAAACAVAFPRARVDAVDISPAALQVARRNLRRLGLTARVRALHSDYFDAVEGLRYDIIVSNPPYVGSAEMRGLPREYRHEPRFGLAAGADGLDAVRAILDGAARHLRPDGLLIVEVGNSERALQRAFPRLPFVWPHIAMGGGGVFMLRARDVGVPRPGR